MHKITSKPITLDCFEMDDYEEYCNFHSDFLGKDGLSADDCESMIFCQWIPFLEELRKKYLETKDIRYWKELIRWLPESWLQTRTVTMNYENLFSIVFHRGYHKLKAEWCDGFIKWCTTLPYAKELIFYGEKREKIYNLYA